MTWKRYVAIGDSSTEGLEDPDGAGGYRGWADRLAEHVARAQGGLEYANLAVRGRLAGQIREEQLPIALALEPDLATVVAGMNDVLRPSFDARVVAAHLEAMFGALTGAGATVLTFTFPDPVPVMPICRPLRPRFVAFNDALRAAARRTGALVLDLAAQPGASDPRLWHEDRLHGNSEGHRRIADGLASLLGIPGIGSGWATPLPWAPPRPLAERLRIEAQWARTYLFPWLGRRFRGESSGDGRTCKRPELAPVELIGDEV